jgi:pimeloyl-ACP methyl ester carboxylesterase
MKDREVEAALAAGESSGLLEDYFGSAQYAELRRLSQEAALSAVRGGERVLILHGIMGSKLGRDGARFDDVIWVNPLAIALGRLSELTLPGQAKSIKALGVLLFAYLKLKLKLRIAGYDADFFAYDWRLDLVELGKRLADQIKGDGRRVHLVAHSMGGLVARAALLEKTKSIGRIVMLGTPNFGSFSPIQAFRGVHAIVRKVDFIDPFHSGAELAGIFGTFPGLSEMIPSPQKYPADFFQLSSWPNDGPRPTQAMLTASAKVQARLPAEHDELFVIAGVGQETTVDAKVQGGEFVYTMSTEGDGTVPLQCALLPTAKRTYFIAEEHGSLPNNADVARAVDDILGTGETKILPSEQPRRAGATREISERALDQTPYVGNRGRALSAREKRAIVAEVAAADRDPVSVAPLSATLDAAAASPESAIADQIVIGRRRHHRLEVTLAFGSITEAEADAYVLGAFKLVPPGGAASAIDGLMGGAISQIFSRRMFNANVGEVSILPTGKHPVRADIVAFAGLGPFDSFNEDVLEIVGENLVRTFVSVRVDNFATVPIGGSSGAFTAGALRRLMLGFLRGLQDADLDHRFRGITICEVDRNRFMAMQREFYHLCGTQLFDGVEVTLREVELPQPPMLQAPREAGAPRQQNVFLIVRQESKRDADPVEYGCSVLTAGAKATIFKGRQQVPKRELEAHLEKLGTDRGLTQGAIGSFGGKLAEMVLPTNVRAILERHIEEPLVVVHDAASSRIPWETLRIAGKFPVLGAGLSHRYETEDLSIAKWLEVRQLGKTLNVLLIVNPTEDLDGAEAEGDRINRLFGKLSPAVTLLERRGPQARKREIEKCLASGTFDVIHYAGHAAFDPVNPSRSGIICAGGEILSGGELATLGSLPSLVFFNACESGRLRRGSKRTTIDDRKHPIERVRRGVSFAEAFMRGGVANYLGTYWPVGDASALAFAENFYQEILAGQPLGNAVLTGRKAVEKLRSVDWADYILFGDTNFVLKKRD